MAGGSEVDRVDSDDSDYVQLLGAEIRDDYGRVRVRDVSNDDTIDLYVISIGRLALVCRLPVQHETIGLDACQVDIRTRGNLKAQEADEFIEWLIEHEVSTIGEPDTVQCSQRKRVLDERQERFR